MASLFIDGGAGTGWTLYPTLSLSDAHSGACVDLLILSLHLAGVASLVGAITIIATILCLPFEATVLLDLPLFVYSQLVTAGLLTLSLPVLAGALTMLLMDRHMNTAFFVPGVGGDVVLFQHLF